MAWILTKVSKPGWTKQFEKQEDAEDELYAWNCEECRASVENELIDLIDTPCSVEFMLEEFVG